MEASSVAAFWAVAILLIIVPGPDWAFTISAGLRGGSVLAAVGGLAIGYAAISSVVAAGVGALVTRTPDVLTGLTVAGGLYLMWHGARTFAHPAAPVTAAGAPASSNRWLLVRGIGVSGLNPKGLLIFVALLPQFTNPQSPWPLAAQMTMLGLTFTLTCAGFYALLGSFARAVLLARPAAARMISRLSGTGMVTIGTVLTEAARVGARA